MEEAKESLRRKAYSLACSPPPSLPPSLSPSFPPDRLCLPSLTHSLGRLVAFALFKMPILAPLLPLSLSTSLVVGDSRSRCGHSFMTPPRSQRMGKGCQKLSWGFYEGNVWIFGITRNRGTGRGILRNSNKTNV